MAIPGNLTGQALYNFIGGRRSYNSRRQMIARTRQWKLLLLWAENPDLCKADLARHFGVSRATITRDVKAIKRRERAHRRQHCPLCEGTGSIDTGPGLGLQVEIVSDIKRSFARLFG